jgi:hypothetical protein
VRPRPDEVPHGLCGPVKRPEQPFPGDAGSVVTIASEHRLSERERSVDETLGVSCTSCVRSPFWLWRSTG